MTSYSADRGPRPADPLRLAALTAVIAGVVLLAAAAFVLSYAGIHHLALRAGVTPGLARLYPPVFDAMLVVAGAAALALRGAGWWARFYAWAALLIVLAAVAVGDAIHATHVALPIQPIRAVAAVMPWVLLLAAFGLLLEMLRHFRRVRAGNGQPRQITAGSAAVMAPIGSHGNGGASAGNGAPGNPAQRGAVSWAAAGSGGAGRALPPPPTGLEMLLGPRPGDPPAMPGPKQGGGTAAEEHPGQAARPNSSHNPESVAYGEETGYVHPDSYRDHENHAGAHEGDSGPGAPDHPGHEDTPGQDHPAAADSTAAAADEATAAKDGGPDDGNGTAGSGDQAPVRGDNTAGPGDAAPADGKEANGQAKKDGPKDPQPAAANSAGAPAQAAPAETKDTPPQDGDTAALPPRSVMPLLERLRSTPAPPEG